MTKSIFAWTAFSNEFKAWVKSVCLAPSSMGVAGGPMGVTLTIFGGLGILIWLLVKYT